MLAELLAFYSRNMQSAVSVLRTLAAHLRAYCCSNCEDGMWDSGD